MNDPMDPHLRVRAWVAGELVDETWLDVSNPDHRSMAEHVRDRHDRLIGEQELWLIELYDPAMPEQQAYVRFGTDPAGMVDPQRFDRTE